MDFAFYRNFITVAETGNLSAAAKRLGIVQPALSAQMKAAYAGLRQACRRYAALQRVTRAYQLFPAQLSYSLCQGKSRHQLSVSRCYGRAAAAAAGGRQY